MKRTILQRNDLQISNQLERLDREKNRFITFHEAMKATGYAFDTATFHQLVNGTVDKSERWLKENQLKATPEINNMGINHAAKIAMLPVKDYSALCQAHAAFHADKRREVYQYDLADGGLVISDKAREAIEDANTVYALNDDAVKIVEMYNLIADTANKIKEYGFNPFTIGALRTDGRTNITTVYPASINMTLNEYKVNAVKN